MVAQQIGHQTSNQEIVVLTPSWALLCNDLRQVVHSHVPSPVANCMLHRRQTDGDLAYTASV